MKISYQASFRFWINLGKGMVISELGIPVTSFAAQHGSRLINMGSTDDESVMLLLAQIRKFKQLDMFLSITTPDSERAVRELIDIYDLKDPFFVSFGVQKNADGKKIEAYILRDEQATMRIFPIPITPMGVRATEYNFSVILHAPQLLHGTQGHTFTRV